MKFILIFFLAFAYSLQLKAQDLQNCTKKTACVYILRVGYYAGSINYSFYDNDKYIGSLKGGRFLKYECGTGKQLFWGVADNKNFIELTINASETHIIIAESKGGYRKGNIHLVYIPKGLESYEYFFNKVMEDDAIQFSQKKIETENNLQKDYIKKSLREYFDNRQDSISINQKPNFATGNCEGENPIAAPIIVDYDFYDYPFSKKSVELSGMIGFFSNPSMSQSLNIASSINSLTREGLYKLMNKNEGLKGFYTSATLLSNCILYLPIPFSCGWLHEEYHRAILAKHGGNSYNEMNNFPITKSLISVLDVKDEDLIRLKKESPQDMVRMSEAGIEGELLLANNINKSAFYYDTKSVSIIPLTIALNSSIYVIMCSAKNIDKETIKMNTAEGDNMKKRDLLGLDFLAYTYDLFHSEEPYQNRGIHPSGVGIDRYVKRSQLTPTELSYLKRQGLLQLINLLNPMSFFQTSFSINANDRSTRANIYFNHWLTSFGYDISATTLLHKNNCNYAFTLHNYANYYKWFPGLEFETYHFILGREKIKKPIPISAKIMTWLQPKDELFFSKQSQLGGLIELKCYYPINKYFSPYISVTAKTNGWVAGNVYLESNISGGFGLRTFF